MKYFYSSLFLLFIISSYGQSHFEPLDVYDLEFASDPQFSPDGSQIVYARSFMDIMTDKRLSNLWIVDRTGHNHRGLTTGNHRHNSPRWSPDGKKIAYMTNESGKNQIAILWLDNGQSTTITNVQDAPYNLSWSPDGQWLAFNMQVEKKQEPFGGMPIKPKGAKWADAPKYIDKLLYRADGAGYIEESYAHIFLLPVEGGTPRQITADDFNHGAPEWAPDGSTLYFSANRNPDWEYDRRNSEIFSLQISSKKLTQLTDRYGPDNSPSLSPDGKTIAYLGYDDKKMGYHHNHLYIMNTDGTNSEPLTMEMDISVADILWSHDGEGVYFFYNKEGNSKVGYIGRDGKMKTVAENLGGSSIGRPYDGGDYDVSNGHVVFTYSSPEKPAELALSEGSANSVRFLSDLNKDILNHKDLGQVKEIWYESSHDGQKVQGWIMTPPDFDPNKKYPLLLEIHGGPFANYGDRFSPELQLMASKGFVVLYTNPRGSTSYGEEFANLIHHNYPSNDYDDLMSGVDEVIEQGYIDPDRLFITGGSGGGVLTSWTIGKTDRFKAAVVAKPVINWYSWALTADIAGVVDYWFPGNPWDHQDHFMKRSPISLVGNVKTPTMLLTGEQDFRTPMSESEQYYQALKMQKVPSALVRIQEASHGIAAKPSNLLAKVGYITSWFEKYDKKKSLKP
jgi:acylaminoacyl-peptidase